MPDSPRILLVDDQPEMRRLLRRLMRREGYVLHVASSGKEALALNQALHPALLVLDCEMPGMDGSQILAALREEGYRLPVIMASAHMDKSLAARLNTLGANLCLSKLELGRRLAPAVASLLAGTPAG